MRRRSRISSTSSQPRLAGGRDLRSRRRCKAGAVVGDRRRTTAEILRAATARTNSLASEQHGWEGLRREANTVQKILHGKAIVTGGASGICEATARRFSEHGARAVVIADVQDEKGREVAASIGLHRDVSD
ncbi:hypothetical protein TIFTF001_014901 [Ficus carica]|uniref:SDR family NAD(P)-dependent oxidoreductase n=1 Tax=Ficus carica TaxID=3494 RepID=A0AA88D4J7_FICCA|nr:hypothetical protein TIFTF001_014901 [Ficus carica]